VASSSSRGRKIYKETFRDEYVKTRKAGRTDIDARDIARKAAQGATRTYVNTEGAKLAEARARVDVLRDANGDGIPDAFKNTDAQALQDFADFSSGTRGAMAKKLTVQLPSKTVEEMEALLQKSGGVRHPTTPGTFDTVSEGQISYPQASYIFPDGTLVRIKPSGDVRNGVKPMYSIEMQTKAPSIGGSPQDNVAFKLDPAGNPVPKGTPDLNNPYTPLQPTQRTAYRDEILRLGHRFAKEND
jgi:hypothetical protein